MGHVHLTFRLAEIADARPIAHLHARSWQIHYRGIWPDEFLDKKVLDNRLQTWKQRLENKNNQMRVELAEHEGELWGFCCCLLDHDPRWGTCVDNIHVVPKAQGQGIGRQLLRSVAQWTLDKGRLKGMYLWVLEGNEGAINFYESLGGTKGDKKEDDIPTGGNNWIYRYHWEDASDLL